MKIQKIRIADMMLSSGVEFGTSGVRGRVVDMTDKICYAYTLAFLQYLHDDRKLQRGNRVAIAGDLRSSTPAIMRAVAAAITDAGYQVVNCGHLPSPAVANYGFRLAIPSVMVTGSHIPDDRNGIKFNTAHGEILKVDEEAIRAQSVTLPESIRQNCLPMVIDDALDMYLQRYLSYFSPQSLEGMTILVYEHSGVARELICELLVKLGAEVKRFGRSDTFIPVDTEAIRPEDMRLAEHLASEMRFDAIVSTDGDADRPLIGTEKGVWLRGDIIGVLCARILNIEAVATPISSNTVVERCGKFKRVERTRVGSPYVINAMQTLAMSGYKSIAGYEANGGFLVASDLCHEGRHLEALPTRDAILPILALLVHANQSAVTLSAMANDLPARFTASDRLKDYSTDRSQALIRSLIEGGAPAIEKLFGKLCGDVRSTDLTDGLRIYFSNEEIVHLRPSGNAPELRCYNEADTEARVIAMNRACIDIIRGWAA